MSNNAAIIELGGIRFNDGIADANGCRWFASVSRSGPAVRPRSRPRSGVHGNFYAGGTYGERHLSLDGQVEGPDFDAIKAAELRLAGASNLVGGLGTLLRNDPVPRRISVYRADELLFEPENLRLARFSLGLGAPDPRWYAVPQATQSNGAWLYDYGDLETWPTFTIRGPATNPITLTHRASGKAVRVNRTLTASEVLTIDARARTAQVNGADVLSTLDSSTRWWALTPGLNYLTPQQASIEDFALGTGWEAQLNCALARSTMHAADGVASLAVTALAATTNTQARTSSGTNGAPVTAGTQYSATVSVRALSNGRSGTLYIEWFTAAGAANGNSSQSFTDTTGGWTTVGLIATAPANSAFASVTVNFGAAVSAGEVHFVDKAGLFLGADTTWYRGSANYFTFAGVTGVVNTQWADAYAA